MHGSTPPKLDACPPPPGDLTPFLSPPTPSVHARSPCTLPPGAAPPVLSVLPVPVPSVRRRRRPSVRPNGDACPRVRVRPLGFPPAAGRPPSPCPPPRRAPQAAGEAGALGEPARVRAEAFPARLGQGQAAALPQRRRPAGGRPRHPPGGGAHAPAWPPPTHVGGGRPAAPRPHPPTVGFGVEGAPQDHCPVPTHGVWGGRVGALGSPPSRSGIEASPPSLSPRSLEPGGPGGGEPPQSFLPPQSEETEPRVAELELEPPPWRQLAAPDALLRLKKSEVKRQEVINGELPRAPHGPPPLPRDPHPPG